MSEVFGPITPMIIGVIVTGVTQFIKTNWQLSGRVVQLISLLLSFVLVVPYHLLQFGVGWLSGYEAIVYALASWLLSIGLYEAAFYKKV